MSTWLIVIVVVLVAVYVGLTTWVRANSRRKGSSADRREAVVTFERSCADVGLTILGAGLERLKGQLAAHGLRLDGAEHELPTAGLSSELRTSARELLASWPDNPAEPGDAFLFLRASVTSRHPLVRLVFEESGREGMDSLVSADSHAAATAVLQSAKAWHDRLDAARKRLQSSPETVWSSLTLVGLGMMGLEPDSPQEEAVGSHVRSVLRAEAPTFDLETSIAAALWVLSTIPAAERVTVDGAVSIPMEDAALGASVTRLLAQQAAQGTLDQRARAVCGGQWELLWLAYGLVMAEPDNAIASEAFRGLEALAQRAMRCNEGQRDEAMAALEAAARKSLSEEHAQRVVDLARKGLLNNARA